MVTHSKKKSQIVTKSKSETAENKIWLRENMVMGVQHCHWIQSHKSGLTDTVKHFGWN